ncbi:MAG: amino acid permease [Roseivirga sp.]|jgi:amino acid permease
MQLMKSPNKNYVKIVTLVSLACLSIPLTIYGVWLYVFDLGTTQAERVEIFHGYFPDFLHGRWDTTYVSIIFCVLAIILSSKNMKLSVKIWKAVNIIILVLSGLLLLLNLFSMM